MQRLQLYIENNESQEVLIDLFDNETIQLTSTIQDVKDIGKVFTDFSQTFSVPASETNNKVFRHFYNFNITGNAFDARKKRKALLHINYAPFREGKIFLNSVKMKNNKAYAYEVIFYGKTVSLKDLIGDDELTDLDDLKNYNHEYSESNVRTGLTTGLNLNSQTNSIIYPLITSKKRLFFNSDDPVVSSFFNSSGNLYCDESNLPTSLDRNRGLEFTDLKPAIRAIHIIEAIESKYGISFEKDVNNNFVNFFGSTAFSNLYLWLNSKKGEFNDLDDNEDFAFNHTVTGYASSSPSVLVTVNGSELTVNMVIGSQYDFNLDITVSDQNIEYEVILRNKTKNKEYKNSVIGNKNVVFDILDITTASFDVFEWEIKSKNVLTIVSANFILSYKDLNAVQNGLSAITKTYTTSTSQTTTFEIDLISKESPATPNMKVMDFLTGLFKMFNLTAYFIDDYGDSQYGKIYVDTLDNYYADSVNNKLGGLIDIDKYLDASQHTVNSVLPFTDINFNYQETKTVLMDNHKFQFNKVFGDAEFNVKRAFPDEIDRGEKYNIELPFSHMKYERLLDLGISRGVNATTDTSIQLGYCAGGEFNADTTANTGDYDTVLIEPLLFYAINVTGLPAASNANSNRSGKINWISSSPNSTNLDRYWRPSNANDNGNTSTPPTFSLNLDQEFDEFQGVNYGPDSNSLYNVFYKSYVESVFNPLKRMFKVKAFLPPNIVINYRLNDQIKIQDKIFRINSITTNLMTGESELELLNIFSSEIVG